MKKKSLVFSSLFMFAALMSAVVFYSCSKDDGKLGISDHASNETSSSDLKLVMNIAYNAAVEGSRDTSFNAQVALEYIAKYFGEDIYSYYDQQLERDAYANRIANISQYNRTKTTSFTTLDEIIDSLFSDIGLSEHAMSYLFAMYNTISNPAIFEGLSDEREYDGPLTEEEGKSIIDRSLAFLSDISKAAYEDTLLSEKDLYNIEVFYYSLESYIDILMIPLLNKYLETNHDVIAKKWRNPFLRHVVTGACIIVVGGGITAATTAAGVYLCGPLCGAAGLIVGIPIAINGVNRYCYP